MKLLKLLVLIVFVLNANAQTKISVNKEIITHLESSCKLNYDLVDSAIGNSRIVFLGESSHGVEEYSSVKFELIKHLNQKLGFKTILFESGIAECYFANKSINYKDSIELLKNTLFSIWHTETNLKLMSYLKMSKMNISGFDFQYSGKMQWSNDDFILSYDTDFSNKIRVIDSSFNNLVVKSNYFLDSTKKDIYIEYLKIKENADSVFYNFSHNNNIVTKNRLFIEQIIKNKLFYIKNYSNPKLLFSLRDSIMASNIEWLIEKNYPNDKIIIWGHNCHIAKEKSNLINDCYMGKILNEKISKESYTIGLFSYSGNMVSGNKVIKIKKPSKKSLEGRLYNSSTLVEFYNLKNSSYNWGNKSIETFYWGNIIEKIKPVKYYDGIILIKEVSVPKYLK